jgi:hypothetical protein
LQLEQRLLLLLLRKLKFHPRKRVEILILLKNQKHSTKMMIMMIMMVVAGIVAIADIAVIEGDEEGEVVVEEVAVAVAVRMMMIGVTLIAATAATSVMNHISEKKSGEAGAEAVIIGGDKRVRVGIENEMMIMTMMIIEEEKEK